MAPCSPTAQQCAASVHATSPSHTFVPDLRVFQCAPPSRVARMMPSCPTAQPWSASANVTASSHLWVPDVCARQWAPPSLVTRMVPCSPTAQPWSVSTNATESRVLPCGSGFCQTQAPSPVEMKAQAGAAIRRASTGSRHRSRARLIAMTPRQRNPHSHGRTTSPAPSRDVPTVRTAPCYTHPTLRGMACPRLLRLGM